MKAVIYNSFKDRFVINCIAKIGFVAVILSYNFISFSYFLVVIGGYAFSSTLKSELYLVNHMPRKTYYKGQVIATCLHILITLGLLIIATLVMKLPLVPTLIRGIFILIISLMFMLSWHLSAFQKEEINPFKIAFAILGIMIILVIAFSISEASLYPMERYVYLLGFAFLIWTPTYIRQLSKFFKRDFYQKEARS